MIVSATITRQVPLPDGAFESTVMFVDDDATMTFQQSFVHVDDASLATLVQRRAAVIDNPPDVAGVGAQIDLAVAADASVGVAQVLPDISKADADKAAFLAAVRDEERQLRIARWSPGLQKLYLPEYAEDV